MDIEAKHGTGQANKVSLERQKSIETLTGYRCPAHIPERLPDEP